MTKTDSKFFTLKADLMFKAVYVNENSDYHLLEQLLSECFEKPVKVIRLLDPELPIRKKNEKSKRVDVLIELDGEKINLELNGANDKSVRFRNLCYFNSFQSMNATRGEDYDDKTNYIQIQLTFGMGIKEPYISKYKIYDPENKKSYTDKYNIIEFNMDKYQKLWDNLDFVS